jgi:nucleotide-binding universal stress UspA family protein
MYERILVPTVGGEESTRVVGHALALAEVTDAELHALYVVGGGGTYRDIDEAGVEWGPLLQAVRRAGETTIGDIEHRADDAGVEFVGEVRDGDAVYREILDYADEHDIDLIVMGTHGRRGIDRWLLGSVTERVVRTAEMPVLTVRTAVPSD